MDIVTLDAKSRQPGKGAARAARREREVPCVLYGAHQEPVSFQIHENEIHPLIYTTEFHRVSVQVEGESYDCILKHVDFHPTSDRPMHADFQVLSKGEKLTLTVPIRSVGTSIGQRDGGRIYEPMNDIEITCLPKDIPDHIEINVEDVAIGDAIYVSDLEVENVEFSVPGDTVIFSVMQPRLEIEEDEDELDGLEIGEEGDEEPETVDE